MLNDKKCVKIVLPDRSKERSVIVSFVSILLRFNTPTDVCVSLTQIKVYNQVQQYYFNKRFFK